MNPDQSHKRDREYVLTQQAKENAKLVIRLDSKIEKFTNAVEKLEKELEDNKKDLFEYKRVVMELRATRKELNNLLEIKKQK